MNSFYSLIKISPNSSTEDSLVVGIVLYDGETFHSKFSASKKKIAKSLLKSDTKIIDLLLKEFEGKLHEFKIQQQKGKEALFNIESTINEHYFSYLSQYSNGLLKITAPRAIYDAVTPEKFNQLYHLTVDPETPQKAVKITEQLKETEQAFYEKIDKNLIQRVEKKVHTNIHLDSNFAPTLLNRFKMDCIGKNGSLIGAKCLPLTQSVSFLHKELNTYISVIAHLKNEDHIQKRKNRFFLIADEPIQKSSKEYKIYKHLKESESIFKLINSDESAIVAEKIESQNAQTFLELSQ